MFRGRIIRLVISSNARLCLDSKSLNAKILKFKPSYENGAKNMISESYLSCIAIAGGEAFEIEINPSQPTKVNALIDDGFQEYLSSRFDTVDLLKRAAKKSLDISNLAPEVVDAFLVITESFWDNAIEEPCSQNWPDHQRLREKILRGFRDIELSKAVPYANWLSACGNLVPSIGIASALVQSCQHDYVLVVAADRQAEDSDRIMENGASIFSDGAAACFITKEKNEFRIIDVISHAHLPLLSTQDDENYIEFFMQTQKTLLEFSQKVTHRIDRTIGSIQYLITDNYSSSFLSIFTEILQLSPDKLLTPTKRYGHIFSADTLWSLRDLQQKFSLREGDTVGLLNIGICTWSLLVLEATDLIHKLTGGNK